MSDKFQNVPVKDGAEVVFCEEVQIKEFDAFYAKWEWNGLVIENMIFKEEDLKGKTDEAILTLVASSPISEQGVAPILTKEHGYVYVSFHTKPMDLDEL
ncbi:hypothetical protein [Sediminitomix flava]|uniref:Uncharacterized protein n=1 Tax=Sediminitomix flava TaxID=379075 RepID=A0A315ZE25_SEDFL|nr:hypothetical protein [Sediminitomix flava]PWJ43400.1 hypothetical protein BC781_102961 [Sediminitomix flava]